MKRYPIGTSTAHPHDICVTSTTTQYTIGDHPIAREDTVYGDGRATIRLGLPTRPGAIEPLLHIERQTHYGDWQATIEIEATTIYTDDRALALASALTEAAKLLQLLRDDTLYPPADQLALAERIKRDAQREDRTNTRQGAN